MELGTQTQLQSLNSTVFIDEPYLLGAFTVARLPGLVQQVTPLRLLAVCFSWFLSIHYWYRQILTAV